MLAIKHTLKGMCISLAVNLLKRLEHLDRESFHATRYSFVDNALCG
jgi:hypothetical protein